MNEPAQSTNLPSVVHRGLARICGQWQGVTQTWFNIPPGGESYRAMETRYRRVS